MKKSQLKQLIKMVLSEADLSKWALGENDRGIDIFMIDDARSPLDYKEVFDLAAKNGVELSQESEEPDNIQSETGGYTPYKIGVPKHQSDSFLMALEAKGVVVEVL